MAHQNDTLPADCATCGAAYSVDEATQDGNDFTEHHSCANGHTGTITGVEGEPVSEWSVRGKVFVTPPLNGEPDLTSAERERRAHQNQAARYRVVNNVRRL